MGIDLSPEIKQCNFDCLYCELKGAKTVATASNVPSIAQIHDALQEALAKFDAIDVITLTANGEPTLYPELDKLIDALLLLKTTQKLLILSNGSTIADPLVQKALAKLDIVKLSLDCATLLCFKKLDRAHKGIAIETIIEGMKAFRTQFNKELVLEVLVVDGLNDTEAEFKAINRALQAIKPDRVDIGTIDRPPAYPIKGVSIERLLELSELIENVHVNIAYKKTYIPEKRHFSEQEIIELLKRRPQSSEDIRLCFDDESIKTLNDLDVADKIYIQKIAGVEFYKVNE